MSQPAILIGLVLIPVLLLVILVWWRFYGSGKTVPIGSDKEKLQPYLKIKKYRYDVSDFIRTPLPPATLVGHRGLENILDLVDVPATAGEKNNTVNQNLVNSKIKEHEEIVNATPAGDWEENLFPEIGSIPVALYDTISDAATGGAANPDEKGATIPPSLFYNPVTAPANSVNDFQNRQALAEHRTRKGAALRAKLKDQKEAIGELFTRESVQNK